MIVIPTVAKAPIKPNRNCVAITKEFFDEMLAQVKPLLGNGECSELQIKKQFRNLPASVVEHFLSQALSKWIIKEDMGAFILVREQVYPSTQSGLQS